MARRARRHTLTSADASRERKALRRSLTRSVSECVSSVARILLGAERSDSVALTHKRARDVRSHVTNSRAGSLSYCAAGWCGTCRVLVPPAPLGGHVGHVLGV